LKSKDIDLQRLNIKIKRLETNQTEIIAPYEDPESSQSNIVKQKVLPPISNKVKLPSLPVKMSLEQQYETRDDQPVKNLDMPMMVLRNSASQTQ
jgi:hypothetical protein